MTAAVAPAAPTLPHPELPHQGPPHPGLPVPDPSSMAYAATGALSTRTTATHRERRIPHLVPVPDCEPPFDDELVAAGR